MKRLALSLYRKINRFIWRVILLRYGPGMWRGTRYIDNRPPTEKERTRGMELAKKYGLLLFFSIICSAYPTRAQQYTLEMTGSLYANTVPHMAADVSALIRIDEKMRSYTRMEFRPLILGQIAHSTSTGIEYNLFTSPKLDLNSMIQAGIATGPSATGGVFTGGGNLVIKPSWTRGLQFVVAGELVSSPALQDREPQVRFGFRYPLVSQ